MKIHLIIRTVLVVFPCIVATEWSFSQSKTVDKFIPNGFSIMARKPCDINRDGLMDLVVVLKNKYEKMNPDTTRPMIILLGNDEGKYRFFARNDNVVLCHNCGGIHGEPFVGISSTDGGFVVRHVGGSGWRWTRDIAFKFSKREQHLTLEKDRGWSWHINNPKIRSRVVYRTETIGSSFEKYSNNTDSSAK